jgi:organic radical activating enzyme
LHVTHTCNLACESCSHYSNHGHSGNLNLNRADHWMATWSRRIDVEEIRLLGGEPTVHPDFPEFIPLARRHWPLARIRIVTNGFFLRRHPDLPLKMADAGNADLALSIHHDSPAYLARLRPITDLLAKWQRDHGTIFHTWSSYQGWTKRYIGNGDDMQPFEDGRPRLSLSETSSGWRLTENRAMLLFNEGTFQAHWLDGCRSISVAGSARGRNLDIAAAN